MIGSNHEKSYFCTDSCTPALKPISTIFVTPAEIENPRPPDEVTCGVTFAVRCANVHIVKVTVVLEGTKHFFLTRGSTIRALAGLGLEQHHGDILLGLR